MHILAAILAVFPTVLESKLELYAQEDMKAGNSLMLESARPSLCALIVCEDTT